MADKFRETREEYKKLLSLFKKYNIRYLVVGGYAVMKYTEPRYTKDIDLWIATEKNADAAYAALKEFGTGTPLSSLKPEDFTEEYCLCS